MSQLMPSNIMERNTYLKTNIKATAKQIYKAWLSTQGHTKMTGGSSDKGGDKFTAWGGYIAGENLVLEP